MLMQGSNNKELSEELKKGENHRLGKFLASRAISRAAALLISAVRLQTIHRLVSGAPAADYSVCK